ncbi:PLC-like phosphodiesterase [Phaeosphaeria sp. MPI-PUGE-AT-0046c]|nr:PLC-like phosphodiesterase [Phaeosphaeria sp. MPI-PUGE-AT-0046c]
MFLRNLLQASAILPFFYPAVAAQNACNNSPDLCSRAYNNITHLGAHDSPFLRDQSTSFSTSGNHFYNTTVQLDAGVRMLSAQVHKTNNSGSEAWHLCHSSCTLLDAGSLQKWLEEIKAWMDRNTNDVVTVLIVNSDDAPSSELGAQFSASGIDKLAYTPPSPSTIPQKWPTLDNLISNNTRLMTFVASLTGPATDHPYLMDQYAFMFENNFENVDPSNYSCNPSRPTNLRNNPQAALQSNRMFLMNHFLYDDSLFGIQITNVSYANTTNAQTGLGSLGVQVKNCTGVYSKPPSFVMVDWFNMGPAIASVDSANQISGATGRKSVSTSPLVPGTSGVDRRQGNILAVVLAVGVAVAFAS